MTLWRSLLGVPLACLTLVACGGSDGSTATTTTGAPTTTTATIPDGPPEGIPAAIDSLEAGQCLNDVPAREQRTVVVLAVGCERPHRYEVYLTFRFPPGGDAAPKGAPYPGETAVRSASEQECFAHFEGWMGHPWSASEYDIVVWWPSAEGWAETADRKVVCAVYPLSGDLTMGSVAGTAS